MKERGSAQINIELKNGVITVRHTHPLGDILYTRDAKLGDWNKIWEVIRPETFEVYSSHGSLTVNRNTGEVLAWDCDEELSNINKFDIVEYMRYHHLPTHADIPERVDILDIGYWYFSKGEKYEPANEWRQEILKQKNNA